MRNRIHPFKELDGRLFLIEMSNRLWLYGWLRIICESHGELFLAVRTSDFLYCLMFGILHLKDNSTCRTFDSQHLHRYHYYAGMKSVGMSASSKEA